MKHLFLSLMAAALMVANEMAAEPKQPNIICILTDDLGLGDVGVFFQNARRAAGDRAEPWQILVCKP